MKTNVAIGGLFLSLLLSTDLFAQTDSTKRNEEVTFFEKEVRPILVEKCQSCHGDVKPKGGLSLTSKTGILNGGDSGPAVIVGKAKDSLLLKAVNYHDSIRMPPKGKITDRQIESLEKWIANGLVWPGVDQVSTPAKGRGDFTESQRGFWSFQSLKATPPPRVRDEKWARNDIDRFILAKLEERNLAPSASADKRTLLRRATFDLIGLPPTPAEIDAFINDDSPDAFAKVIDRLLASPQYGERWGRHWLDLVRYADARDLIQLPPESDFREIWRYRDWVIDSFNRDMSYADFVRHQIAGDLLPPVKPGGIYKEGLIATGMFALADFVPGDVDKNQMIADYVNDEIDVVSRVFLGLSVACARCHDHKFDPISTDDYYALAGIFFSTRIVPGPVPGNTPLVKVPLLSPGELAEREANAKQLIKRREQLERSVPVANLQEYRAFVTSMLATQSAKYLFQSSRILGNDVSNSPSDFEKIAISSGLHTGLLIEWTKFLRVIAKNPSATIPEDFKQIASGKLSDDEIRKVADRIQASFVVGARKMDEQIRTSTAAKGGFIYSFRADDPQLTVDENAKVLYWPNSVTTALNALPASSKEAPRKITTTINGHAKSVVRFNGENHLSVPGSAPVAGSIFLVFRVAENARSGERLVGWEDADSGKHGLGVMTDPGGKIHSILRQDGKAGDIVDTTKTQGFQTLCINWGPEGAMQWRNGKPSMAVKAITGLSADPAITSLKIGGPGSGTSLRFTGEIAEVLVLDHPATEVERQKIESELRTRWFEAMPLEKDAAKNPGDLFEELRSPAGPFKANSAEQFKRLSPEAQKRITDAEAELKVLRAKPTTQSDIPMAVVALEGGPKDTRHAGFKDSPIFIRGDHNRLGKIVPRGFPKIIAGKNVPQITSGSGRLQLADWLTRPDNPLTARVMVNRIWQHHFGEGLVRTPNDFGERGERPSHPELLDHLAARFIASNWSVKSLHREIMLSSTYRQNSRSAKSTLAADPENQWFSRSNRRRLDAEAIRDSMLAVSGKLDMTPGGPSITEVNTPRRTVYLQSARTGANTADFGRLFNRADPGSIVAKRDQSVVAPQALFFLNDPFAANIAKSLAIRIFRESPPNLDAQIGLLYKLAFGRPASKNETELARRLLADPTDTVAWERFCLLVLSANEFIYIE